MALTLTLLFFALAAFANATADQSDQSEVQNAAVYIDQAGNLIVNSPPGRDVIINGISVKALFGLQQLCDELRTEINDLLGLPALPSITTTTAATPTSSLVTVASSGTTTVSASSGLAPTTTKATSTTAKPPAVTTSTTTAKPTTVATHCSSTQQPINLRTNGARSVDAIEFDGTVFLVIANSGNSTKSTLDSTIYSWNTTAQSFSVHQSIQTVDVRMGKFFIFSNTLYLVFTNSPTATILRYNPETSLFNSSKTLPTIGAVQVDAFFIATTLYLAVTNDGDSSKQLTQVFEYDSVQDEFNQLQNFTTSGARGVSGFTSPVNNVTYLAVANSKAISSPIMKFDKPTGKFLGSQMLVTSLCEELKPFVIGGVQYLAAAYYSRASVYTINSEIFKLEPLSGQFSLAQTIATTGAYRMEPFVIDNTFYLAVANSYSGSNVVDSTIYRWNSTAFTPFQSIPTLGAVGFRYLSVGATPMLAVANLQNDQTSVVNSQVFKWCNAKFVTG